MSIEHDFQREILSFEEKISLAELEEARSKVRTFELKYQRSRFALDSYLKMLQEVQKAEKPA